MKLPPGVRSIVPSIAPSIGPSIGGAALALAYPDPGWSWIAWVALAPLFASVARGSPRRAAVDGLWHGLAFHAILMRWLLAFGWPAFVLLVLALSAFTALFAAVASAALWRRPLAWSLLVVPAAWIGVEWLRTLGTVAAPWGLLGYTQWQNPDLVVWSAVGGVFAVSAVVALVNAAVAIAARGAPPRTAVAYGIAVACALVAGVSGASVPGIGAPVAPVNVVTGEAAVRVVVVQPNVSQRRQFDPDEDAPRRAQLETATRQAMRAGANIVVWPEAAWPGSLLERGRAAPELAALVSPNRALIAAGFGPSATQSAVVVSGGEVLGRQDKVRLVPFGEAGVVPGAGHRVVSTPFGPGGIVICYESTDPRVARALAAAGARVLYFLTNEAWFDGGTGPRQHLMFAVFRAAESGRDVVRAASTGPSAHVSGDGRVRAILPWNTEGALAADVTLRGGATPYVRFGDAGIALAWVVVAAMAWPWARQRALVIAIGSLPQALLPPAIAAAATALAAVIWAGDIPRVIGSALLAAAAIAAVGVRGAGLRGGSAAASLVWSAGFAAVTLFIVTAGYAAQGFPKAFPSTPSWLGLVAVTMATAAGEEIWLRGAVGGASARLPWLAVAVSVAGTWLLHLGAVPELAAWRLAAAAYLAFVRLRTGSVWGPVLTRGAVDAALVALLALPSAR